MTKWGIIGTGNMGSMLLESWVTARAIQEEDIMVLNRSAEKAVALKRSYPGIQIADALSTIADYADYLFLCVRPPHLPGVCSELYSLVRPDQVIVSITSPFSVEELETRLPSQVARAIPSITNRAAAGTTLLTFGSTLTNKNKAALINLFSSYSDPVYIPEDITRVASDIVSCGPAFFSYLAQRFIEGAAEETDISREQATQLTAEMLIGLGTLLGKGHYTLDELIKKVCVKGGITGEGIAVLEKETGGMFSHLFQATHRKYYEEKDAIKKGAYK
ncbi:competence protein ComER [Terribacillus aidingensis]|uniref:Competence protein ComER n=1 Tax=Terribacillus aidingensis TaxID=586416 RepID=A0A285NPE3_9BACI|nr:late competence protein ComER [Terribacillus aidingensis]SNZ11088.1 competence protein ComER [Terribacillus aidingensis]